MRGWWASLLLLGCEGEPVEESKTTDAATADAATADAATADAATADGDTADGAVPTIDSGPCGVHPGPRMVQLTTSKGIYCIDTTEVTNAQYAYFSKAPTKPPHPAYCKWKTTTAVENPLPAARELPMVNLDWCDAAQYCEWAGKRLCGGVAGGPVIRTGTTLGDWVKDSQWTLACQNNVPTAYSTGDTFPGGAAGACNVTKNAGALWSTTPASACKGAAPGFDQITDLTGNAGEWEDNCAHYDEAGAANVKCFIRGGVASPGPVNDFDYECTAADIITARNEARPKVGFRCCSK